VTRRRKYRRFGVVKDSRHSYNGFVHKVETKKLERERLRKVGAELEDEEQIVFRTDKGVFTVCPYCGVRVYEKNLSKHIRKVHLSFNPKDKRRSDKDKLDLLKARRQRMRYRPTEAEKEMARILHSLKIRFISQKGFMTKYGFYIVDFYIPKPYRVAIEVDGAYHDYKKKYDERRTEYLEEVREILVLRFTNEEVLAKQKDFKEKLKKYLALYMGIRPNQLTDTSVG
jgi:very-short-patch-repair endonuclease